MGLFALRFSKLLRSLQHPLARRCLLSRRVLAAVEHSPVLSIGFDQVFDVGANRGQFAIAARMMNPAAEIHSFEPLSGPANVLKENFLSDSGFVIHPLALGSNSGRSVIHVAGRDDSSSLLQISALQQALYPGTGEVGTEEISVCRFDELFVPQDIKSRSILKIDTQGFELEVIKGAGDLIGKIGWVYCECSFQELYAGQALAGEVVSLLGVKGFSVSGMYNPSYDNKGVCVQADILFSSESRCKGE